MTSYIILQRMSVADTPEVGWHEVGPPVESVSAESAVRKAIDGDKGGTYVAVPLRSWSPITVKVETKRVLTLT